MPDLFFFKIMFWEFLETVRAIVGLNIVKTGFIPLKAIDVGPSSCGKFCTQDVWLNPELQETIRVVFCCAQVHIQQLVVEGAVMFEDDMSGHDWGWGLLNCLKLLLAWTATAGEKKRWETCISPLSCSNCNCRNEWWKTRNSPQQEFGGGEARTAQLLEQWVEGSHCCWEQGLAMLYNCCCGDWIVSEYWVGRIEGIGVLTTIWCVNCVRGGGY